MKPGYKETEVGVIPKDWEVKRLGSVGHWFSGGTPSMANDLYWNGEIPWVSAKDMKVSRLLDSLLHVTEKAIGNGTRIAPTGAVLIVVRGMILAHTFPVAVATRPVAFNQDMKALVARAGIDSEFILVWLQANAQSILGIASESTHGTKRLASDDLFSTKVGIPPLPEQRAIAETLSDVDALLGALDLALAKKRDLKQAAMQQLLSGLTRLPGFHGEWEVKQVQDVIAGFFCGPSPTCEERNIQDDAEWGRSENDGRDGRERLGLEEAQDPTASLLEQASPRTQEGRCHRHQGWPSPPSRRCSMGGLCPRKNHRLRQDDWTAASSRQSCSAHAGRRHLRP